MSLSVWCSDLYVFLCFVHVGAVVEVNNLPTIVSTWTKEEKEVVAFLSCQKLMDIWISFGNYFVSHLFRLQTVWRWFLTYIKGSHVPVLMHIIFYLTLPSFLTSHWPDFPYQCTYYIIKNSPKTNHIFMGIIRDTLPWWHYTKGVSVKIAYGAKYFQTVLILNWDKS